MAAHGELRGRVLLGVFVAASLLSLASWISGQGPGIPVARKKAGPVGPAFCGVFGVGWGLVS